MWRSSASSVVMTLSDLTTSCFTASTHSPQSQRPWYLWRTLVMYAGVHSSVNPHESHFTHSTSTWETLFTKGLWVSDPEIAMACWNRTCKITLSLSLFSLFSFFLGSNNIGRGRESTQIYVNVWNFFKKNASHNKLFILVEMTVSMIFQGPWNGLDMSHWRAFKLSFWCFLPRVTLSIWQHGKLTWLAGSRSLSFVRFRHIYLIFNRFKFILLIW